MQQARILVVEDEGIVAEDIRRTLEGLGYSVPTTAASAEEALLAVEENRPSLALLDIRIKGDTDGIATASLLRERYDVPCVFLTSHSEEATLGRARVAQPFGYLLKPFNERELRAAIEMALYKHEMEAKLARREEQLRQVQKMEAIGRLAGGLAHDMNNLLSVILSYSTALLEDLPENTPVREDLDQIQRAGQRGAELTRRILAFARRQTFELQAMDLNEVLRGLEPTLAGVVGADVALEIRLGDQLDPVSGDREHLEQLVANLVMNAREAMPKGGKLVVETANVALDMDHAARHLGVAPGPHVMLAIKDTGIGMDDATRARMFEPFFTTKQKGTSAGLGLSTVFSVVQNLGGHLDVESTPKRGTAVRVYFPRGPVAEAHAPKAPARAPANALRGTETVLVVEDEATVRGVVCTILRRAGYRVLDAGDATQAIALCAAHDGPLHLLLSDVMLPGAGGPELAAKIKKVRPEVAVLLMSGYSGDIDTGSSTREAHPFLAKPFTPESLCRKVREVLVANRVLSS